jgi:murein tripeptide amidase MpaA
MSPTPERSPEVLAVRNRMDETGVDFAMDVHGDEAIPYVFLAGFEGIPNWTERQGALYAGYREILARRSPDFQFRHGYGVAGAGQANLWHVDKPARQPLRRGLDDAGNAVQG